MLNERADGLGWPTFENSTCFLVRHGKLLLADLDDLAMENPSRRSPSRPTASGDEKPEPGSQRQEPVDELLNGCRVRDEVVVVDDQPGVLRPFREIVGEKLGEGSCGLLGRFGYPDALPKVLAGSGNDRDDDIGDTDRERGDIR
jgi:hypothetical protein